MKNVSQLLSFLLLLATPYEAHANPCEGVSCSGAGTCVVAEYGGPACACFPGYAPDSTGLNCLPTPSSKSDDAAPQKKPETYSKSTQPPLKVPPKFIPVEEIPPRFAVTFNPLDFILGIPVFHTITVAPRFLLGIVKYFSIEISPMWARLLNGDYSEDGHIDIGGVTLGLRFNLNWLENFYVALRTGVLGGHFTDYYYDWYSGIEYYREPSIAMIPFEAGIGGGVAWGRKVKFLLNVGGGYRGLFGVRGPVGDGHSFYINGSIGVAWGTKHIN